jgi:hypothetical protein
LYSSFPFLLLAYKPREGKGREECYRLAGYILLLLLTANESVRRREGYRVIG